MKLEVTVLAASLAVTASAGKPCNTAVSKGPGTKNVECQALCEAGDISFDDKCLHQHYALENQRSRPDSCFNKWVYGYSEGPELSSFKTIPTDTPALCQAECQAEDECFNWIWTTEHFAVSGGAQKKTCYLKTKKHVEKALGISTAVAITDTKHCNYGMNYQCTNKFYNCLECGGDMRCVWESDNHVNGWKYCGDTDVCAPAETILPPPVTTTQAATPAPTEPLTEAPTTTPPSTTTSVATTLSGVPIPTVTQAPPMVATVTADTLPGGLMPNVTPAPPVVATVTADTLPGGVMPNVTPAPPVVATVTADTLPGGVMPNVTPAPPVVATVTADTLPGGVMPSVKPPGAATLPAVVPTLPGGVMPSLTAPECAENSTDAPECVPATKPSACKPNCACGGSGGCGCCNARAVEIRVMDRPKHLEFHLEN